VNVLREVEDRRLALALRNRATRTMTGNTMAAYVGVVNGWQRCSRQITGFENQQLFARQMYEFDLNLDPCAPRKSPGVNAKNSEEATLAVQLPKDLPIKR
jgi:hypothetical protein